MKGVVAWMVMSVAEANSVIVPGYVRVIVFIWLGLNVVVAITGISVVVAEPNLVKKISDDI